MRKKITLVQRIGFVFGFIIACFFALSFISTLIISLLNPTMTVEFVKSHFIFSRFSVVSGFLIHIIGNILFAAVAIFFALLSWKGFTSQGKNPEGALVSIEIEKNVQSVARFIRCITSVFNILESINIRQKGDLRLFPRIIR